MLFPIAIAFQEQQYQVKLPDVPEVTVLGVTMADAIANAQHELLTYFSQLSKLNKDLPKPSDVADFLGHADYAGCTWAIINIEPGRVAGEMVQMHFALPKTLLSEIDNHVGEHKAFTSYGQFFAFVAQSYIHCA